MKKCQAKIKKSAKKQYSKFQNRLKNKQITLIISLVGCILAIPASIFYIQTICQNINPSYDYDTNTQWMQMQNACNLLTDKSKINIYCDPEIHAFDNPSETYYLNGVSLVALFSNKADVERSIIKFSLYVDEIVEDLAPDITVLMIEPGSNPITAVFKNVGWSESGELCLSIKDICFSNDSDNNIVEISLMEGSQNNWKFDSIPSGETHSLSFVNTDIFKVVWKDQSINSVPFYIDIEIYSPETAYKTSFSIPLEATPDGVIVPGMGGESGDTVNYVIIVDTSSNKWFHSYDVYQRIPAKQTVRLPIFILPTKSCTMSVRAVFEMEDGELIEVEPLEKAFVKVPYYEDLYSYINGDIINWNQLSDPVNIYFPFKMNNKVLPEMEIN